MPYIYLDEKTLKKEIFKLRRELREDLREVKAYAKTSPLTPLNAVHRMAKLEKNMALRSVSKVMDIEELRKTYRELKNIRDLKSSTLEGATASSQKLMQGIKADIKTLSEDEQKEFWEIYDKLLEHNASFYRYKSDILETASKMMVESGYSADDVIDILRQQYDMALELNSYDGGDSFDLDILFTDLLQELQ